MHLHRCVQIAKLFQESVRKEIGIGIAYGALTMVGKDDTRETLDARLARYLAHAESSGEGKLCYGTCRFDFCGEGSEEEIFNHFFDRHRQITIHNFYNGMPLYEKVEVIECDGRLLRIKTSLAKAAFLRNEPFTFIRHPLLPDTIKADILNTNPTQAEVVLTRLRFIDNSPVDRENIRIMPDERIEATIECLDGGEAVDGELYAISVDSVAIRPSDRHAAAACLGNEEERHVTIGFVLPDRDNHRVLIRVAGILRYEKEDQLIFSIYPGQLFKQKIESYIALQQTKLITIMQKMVLNFYQT